MSLKSKLLKIGIPLIILILGFSIMAALIVSRPEPKKEAREERGRLVHVLKVTQQSRNVIVSATGSVRAAREVSIMPQVGGKVVAVSPSMVAGGFFSAGELMFEIENSDYLLALEQTKASKAKAEYDLATTESQARIAREEWERLNPGHAKQPNPLVLYEPQLKNARAAVASAEAAIEQAKLNLSRTRVYAPFNCRVRSEDIEVGQYIKSGNSIAIVAGTDTVEVTVPLPPEEMKWLSIPRDDSRKDGSLATVTMNLLGTKIEWTGRIMRSLGEIDIKSRMMQVIIEVNDPYGLGQKDRPAMPLTPGSFVEVSLKGRMVTGVFSVPRTAVRDESTVWIMDEEDRLRIRPVQIVRLDRDEALVSNGLEEDDRVVVTALSGAADGMKLRVASEGSLR